MIDGKTVLGVIPARGGSKRLPRKNLVPFRGRFLTGWTIREAFKSRYLDQVTLTTDDAEICGKALRFKGLNIIGRPEFLASDEATSEDVLRWITQLDDFKQFSVIVLLQPTSPLRKSKDIDACIRMCHVEHQTVISYRPDGTKNGAVYVCESKWLKNHTFKDEHRHYLMPQERSLDIDYKEDVVL